MSVSMRTEKETKRVAGIGVVLILVFGIIVFFFGLMYNQKYFPENLRLLNKVHIRLYWWSALSIIFPAIVYFFKYRSTAKKDLNKYHRDKTEDKSKYIYNGWAFWAFISMAGTAIISMAIHYFLFKDISLELWMSLMLWVSIIAGIACGVVFFFPFCRPFKKN